jgi:CrcB protein
MTLVRSGAAVACGAAVGATVRWGVVEVVPETNNWPWAVFVVNVVGSLLLGAILAITHHRTDDVTNDPIRLAFGTGFCGALTTFSTFAVEIAALLREDRVMLGAGYLSASLAVGVTAFVAGRALARNVLAP